MRSVDSIIRRRASSRFSNVTPVKKPGNVGNVIGSLSLNSPPRRSRSQFDDEEREQKPLPLTPGLPSLVGTSVERYEVEALIGRGGMGDVYRAADTRLRRKVALKVLRPDRDHPDAVA